MTSRRMHSKVADQNYPLIEIMWDKSGIMIEAKNGTLDIKAIGPMFQGALAEITAAIKAGKENGIKKSHGEKVGVGSGTPQADSGELPS